MPISTPLEKGYPVSNRNFRPLSYYLSGGSDVDGDALKQTTEAPMADSDDDADTFMNEFGTDEFGELIVPNDPFCDSRQDVFSLFGLSQSPSFKSAIKSAKSSRSEPTVEPTPTTGATE